MEEELLELFQSLPEDKKQVFLDYLRNLQPEEAEK